MGTANRRRSEGGGGETPGIEDARGRRLETGRRRAGRGGCIREAVHQPRPKKLGLPREVYFLGRHPAYARHPPLTILHRAIGPAVTCCSLCEWFVSVLHSISLGSPIELWVNVYDVSYPRPLCCSISDLKPPSAVQCLSEASRTN